VVGGVSGTFPYRASLELRSTLSAQELHQRLGAVLQERLRYVGEDPGRPAELKFVLIIEPTALLLRAATIYRSYWGRMDLVVHVQAMPGGGSRARAYREPQAKRDRVSHIFAALVAGWFAWGLVHAIRSSGSFIGGVLAMLPLMLFAVIMMAFLPVISDRRAVDAEMAQAEQVVDAVFRDSRQVLGATA
jgi:hypothetical protein